MVTMIIRGKKTRWTQDTLRRAPLCIPKGEGVLCYVGLDPELAVSGIEPLPAVLPKKEALMPTTGKRTSFSFYRAAYRASAQNALLASDPSQCWVE